VLSESLQRRILVKLYTRLTAEDVNLIIDTVKGMGIATTILDESKFVYCITSMASVIDDIREIEISGGRMTLEQKRAVRGLIKEARMGR